MRVALTGHNGYIGSVMVPFLQKAGHEILGLDTYLYEECTFGDEVPDVPSIRMDLRDVEASVLVGFDAVIHLAAQTIVDNSRRYTEGILRRHMCQPRHDILRYRAALFLQPLNRRPVSEVWRTLAFLDVLVNTLDVFLPHDHDYRWMRTGCNRNGWRGRGRIRRP